MRILRYICYLVYGKSGYLIRRLHSQYPQYQFGRGTYGYNLKVASWGEGATLKIGAFCSISSGVEIFLGGNHRPDWVTTYPFNILNPAARHIQGQPKSKGDVIIGNDVWIGNGALILSGVHIGDGAVIGARSVVAKDVPPYGIVVGNPARNIRMRFDDATIMRLLNLKWWDWDDTKIQKYLPVMLNTDIGNFLDMAEHDQETNLHKPK
jgi:chloramphenicol O-acetyltransferase type B